MIARRRTYNVGGAAAVAFALSALALGSCSNNDGFGVELHLVFDATISDTQLASVQSLVFHETGDEQSTLSVTLGRSLSRTEREVYRPSLSSRTVALEIDALDSHQAIVASGRTETLTLTAGSTISASVILESGAISDAGVDFTATPDLRGLDLLGVDLSGPFVPTPGGATQCDEANLPSGVLRCRSYETSSDIVRPYTNMGTLTISTAHAYRGTSSLEIQTQAGGNGVAAQAYEILSTPLPTTYSIRAFVYSDIAWPPSTNLMDFEQVASPFNNETLAISTGHLQSSIVTTTPDKFGNSSVPLPVGTWACLTFDVVRSTDNGSVKVYLNDEEVSSMELSGVTEETPDLVETAWGFYILASSPAAEMWIDEVMVASSHISCSE